MKRKLLLLTCTLLLLSGCGSDEDTTTSASSTSEPHPTETSTEFNEEYYLELISEVPIEILGIRYEEYEEWAYPYTLYLIDGNITELSEEYLMAEGVLSNEWHATAETVSVKYYVSDGIIYSGELATTESLLLTPAIPFLSEESLPSVYKCIERYMHSSKLPMEFTQENYPIIETGEGIWDGNYEYCGTLLITDIDGNKYYTSEVLWSYDECFLDTKNEYDCAWGTSTYGLIKEAE